MRRLGGFAGGPQVVTQHGEVNACNARPGGEIVIREIGVQLEVELNGALIAAVTVHKEVIGDARRGLKQDRAGVGTWHIVIAAE